MRTNSLNGKTILNNSRQTLFRIGEIACLTRTTTRTLRYYEELRLIAPSSRSYGKFRLYSRNVVDSVLLIRALSKAGFHLKDIRMIMRVWAEAKSGDERYRLLSNRLEERLKEVRAKIASLRDVEGKLAGFLNHVKACRTCPDGPAEQVCKVCGRVEKKPLEPLLNFAWNNTLGG